MKPVFQTETEAGGGNALQACVASMCELPLSEVPNFIAAPEGYLAAVQGWLAPRGESSPSTRSSAQPRAGREPVHHPGYLAPLPNHHGDPHPLCHCYVQACAC